MAQDIHYALCSDGMGFDAICDGKHVGEITFVNIGTDKIIIDYTDVIQEYRHAQIGLNLVRQVANLARYKNRKIMPLCPFARAMFNRYSEFDDVRLSH